MFPVASLLATLLLALSIAGSPVEIRNSPITIPIVRRLNTSDGPINLLQCDKARVAAVKDGSASTLNRRAGSIPVINEVLTYVAQVGVGSPATTYNLAVDTGSSNTWVGALTPYAKTATSINTGQPVTVDYGSEYFFGTEYTDTVTLGSGLTITAQSIGVAYEINGFTTVDGILGIGPLGLTAGTLTNALTTTIPTVTQNLNSQGHISQIVVGVSFQPTTSEKVTNGELTFGGTDATKYTDSIAYTPLTTKSPSSGYWGIDCSITYGSTTLFSATAAGIVDTGTSLIYIATDAFNKYKSATGATVDLSVGLLTLTLTQYGALNDLNFHIGNTAYSFTRNAQIWPRSLNTYIHGNSNSIYLVVWDLGLPSGQGYDFILGMTFLERFYSVFDTTNSRIGFATTPYTYTFTN
ncbi:aspartic peptidase domain-containing protein [Suillus paluster]|uniref:aspartic peptidase domain-containing protein n=1 Tax=Suillus paluster TaxID=48578 RepID=UPI001B87C123|nr:aspartic peptidase domain-containing protein [Suillus paluster]KAG1754942.1 aspartic peptidase domain-containing protein [Suillus paluster]